MNRQRVRLGLCLLTICICVAIVAHFLHLPKPIASSAAKGAGQSVSTLAEERNNVPSSPAPAYTPQTESPAPIIDEISVERPVICAGEESLVRVRAHVPGNDDKWMRVRIGDKSGESVPVVGALTLDGKAIPIRASVVSGDGRMTTVPVPIEIRDCRPERRALVSYLELANSSDEYEFTARVLDVPARVSGTKDHALPIALVRRYRWSFGDGQHAETTEPTVTHSFANRQQERAVSSFLVGVEAVLENGTPITGRASIELANRGRQTLDGKGVVLIEGAYTPRFAESAPDGSASIKVHLSHIMPREVRVTGLRARMTYEGDQVSVKEIDPPSFLGSSSIPARTGLDVPLSIPAGDPRLLMITYEISGNYGDGTPAFGSAVIMRPPPPPTAEHHREVENPEFAAKIAAARRVLNKPFVTGEEIARLEREGRI